MWRQRLKYLYSDIQKIAVNLERAVGFVRENLLRKYLSKLHAFLIEGVHIPQKALEHNLVFEVSKQRAESLGLELISDDDGRGATAGELFVGVFIVFSAGEGQQKL